MVGLEVDKRVVFIPSLILPFYNVSAPNGRKVFVLHRRLNPGPAVGGVEESIFLVGHEGEKIISRLFLLRQARDDAMPGPAVGVAHDVERILLPLTREGIKCIRRAGYYSGAD